MLRRFGCIAVVQIFLQTIVVRVMQKAFYTQLKSHEEFTCVTIFSLKSIIILEIYITIQDCLGTYREYRSLGTPPRLTFQARLLHNQEGANAEKGGFRKISSRAFFRRIGRCSHPLGCGAIEPGKSV